MFLKKILNTTRLLAKHIFFLVLGSGFALFIITILLVGLPLFIYRWIVTKVLAPLYFRTQSDTMAKAINSTGNFIAEEFLQAQFVPRCTIVVNLTLDGTLSYNKLYKDIEEKWITFELEKGTLRYPELQQYPVPWMGFMFWKTDPNFQLKNHIVVHTLDENKSDVEVDQFKCQLREELINKPYIPKRSPWEVHLVQHYRQSVDSTDTKGTGCSVILRIHHAMSDGYSIIHMLLEQLAGHNLEKTLIAIPKTDEKEKRYGFTDILRSLSWPVRAIHELGHVLSWAFKGRSPLHIPDGQKSWHQIYATTKSIPISKVKYIKNTFEVGFATVFNTALAAALGRMLKRIDECGKRNKIDNLLFGIAVPRPNHPKKLRTHALGVAFDVPVTMKMDPVDRLRKCEEHMLQIKNTPMTTLALVGIKIFSTLPTRLAAFMVRNRSIATGVSSFPGPGHPVDFLGAPVLGIDFVAGAMPGVGGIGFMAISYFDKVQICAIAENAVLDREELHELLEYVQEEFDILYSLAEEHNRETEEANLTKECV